MLTSPATTLDSATRTVLKYKLDQAEWRNGGSPIGFSCWLFLVGGNLTSRQIAYEMSAYNLACSKASTAGEALDDELRVDAESYGGALEEVSLARHRLATLIRNIKLAPSGGRLWVAAASLATTLRPDLVLGEIDRQGLLSALAALLKSILALEGDFPDCDHSEYLPGDDVNMDYLLRVDIERLDRTLLEVPAWLGAEPEVWPEISALLRVANDKSLNAAIEQRTRERDAAASEELTEEEVQETCRIGRQVCRLAGGRRGKRSKVS